MAEQRSYFPDENAEENTFFDSTYRELQNKQNHDSCITGQYTLEEIMHATQSTELSALSATTQSDLKTTTQLRVDEIVESLSSGGISEPEEEDLTFGEMVERNEAILAQQKEKRNDPYVTSVANVRAGQHTERIPVICIPNESIITEDSPFIPIEKIVE